MSREPTWQTRLPFMGGVSALVVMAVILGVAHRARAGGDVGRRAIAVVALLPEETPVAVSEAPAGAPAEELDAEPDSVVAPASPASPPLAPPTRAAAASRAAPKPARTRAHAAAPHAVAR